MEMTSPNGNSNQSSQLENALELIRQKANEGENFLLTFHYLDDGLAQTRIIHSFLMHEFPNSDLMPCVGYLENEFMKILKRGTTGHGRMEP